MLHKRIEIRVSYTWQYVKKVGYNFSLAARGRESPGREVHDTPCGLRRCSEAGAESFQQRGDSTGDYCPPSSHPLAPALQLTVLRTIVIRTTWRSRPSTRYSTHGFYAHPHADRVLRSALCRWRDFTSTR